MRASTIILPVIVIVIVGLLSTVFIVDEREKALVLQFGRVVDIKEEPGIAFKLPLVQQVVRYDDRILSRDVDPLEITPLDDRRLVVDAFARYRIVDVNRFREATGAAGDQAIQMAGLRLDSILRATTREVLGSVSSNDILSSDRAALMMRIRNAAYDEAQELGLEIIDVRLKRTDLPRENLDATFARMRAEREREAADEVARGNEAAQRIRAQADRTQVEIVSDAQRQSEIIRGEADARRSTIFADAYGAAPEFFEFYRSLEAYRRALQGDNSSLVMSPDSEFFSYLKSDRGLSAEDAARVAEQARQAAGETGDAASEGSDSPAALPAPESESGDQGSGAQDSGTETGATGTGEEAMQPDEGSDMAPGAQPLPGIGEEAEGSDSTTVTGPAAGATMPSAEDEEEGATAPASQ
ncbi:protease modulator HflC [Aquicoccus sp. SCR17]|nr:protease modulator HflC [Carideicomes alvinocaridis]